MDTFDFYQDCKVTCWERTRFSIKADSYEEAKAIILSWKDKDINSHIGTDENITGYDYELNPETVEGLSPAENDNAPTMEIYGQGDELLYDNTEGEI